MAGLFDKQAELYSDARPTYPAEWYSMLSALTPHHSLALDVGTGNGQAALAMRADCCPPELYCWRFRHLVPRVQFVRKFSKASIGEKEN